MTQTVTATLAGEIVISIDELPDTALAQLKNALTIPNEEREKALSLKQFGAWDLPEFLPLWREETHRSGAHVLCLPRGFASQLVTGLGGYGIEVTWDDQRTSVRAAEDYYRPFLMRDYQAQAAAALIAAQQGFYKAPAGAGKTVTVLGALAIIGQRAMIITDKANLLEQWRTRAAQFFGMPLVYDEDGRPSASLDGDRCPGKIGQDVWEERDLTVALRQTLHSRGWSLDATKWWGTWGATIFDEGHHLAAETTGNVSRGSTSFYLWGVSATPAGSQAKAQIVHSLVGPIVHETTRPELYARKVLMRPTVEVIDGDLDSEFWPDHDAEYDKASGRYKCQKPGCSNGARKHMHRNNYASVLKELVESPERNDAIAKYIAERRGHYHLIPSRQKKHLDLLKKAVIAAGWPKEKIWMLRGEENAEGLSQQIADEVTASDEAIILSTVADEGLDIPPLDYVHMVFPIRKDLPVIQLVGRVERIHPGKEKAVIVDWREPGVSVFAEQFRDRLTTFEMQTYEVIYINKEEK